jgi:hypothetical protein
MHLILLAAIVAVSSATIAHAQEAPTRVRDCLSDTEFGIPAPASSHPDAKWLYITNVMRSTEDGTGTYGSAVGWKVAGSLKLACDAALSDFSKMPENQEWTITGAVVQLVPDSIIKQGSAH